MNRSVRHSAAIALAVVLATPVASRAGELVDIHVFDRDSGRLLQETPHRGDRWVGGQPGHRYGVELHNRTDARVLVVLSVDGVNAVTGQTASTRQSGYVLDPGERTRIDGWRKSMDHVAQFVFTRVPDSYAARTGRPDNVGVIGAAVFRERVQVRPMIEEAGMDAAAPTASRANSAKAEEVQRVGTGHGALQRDHVDTTEFERDSDSPAEVLTLRYDSPGALRQRGILPRTVRPHGPQAFPSGFVPDPPR